MNKINLEVTLKPGEEGRLSSGHLWIFSNELKEVDSSVEPGTPCRVVSVSGQPLAIGFFNPRSLISVRILQKGGAPLPVDFLKNRLSRAAEYRRVLGIGECGRMCYGESDGLPGLIVDRYAGVLVVEMLSAGMERMKEEIISSLKDIFQPSGIFLKNDHEFRKLEGLPLESAVAFGSVPDSVVVEENGLKFEVRLKSGQKTGYFFDQRENREFLKPFFRDRKVMDLYCYTGSFALLAAASGASQVWGVDSSAPSIELARRNAEINGLAESVVFQKEDAQRILSALKSGETPDRPDFMLLDPPNLVRNRKTFPQSRRLYVKLNQAAIECLPKGGLLATSSCSHHVTRETFVDMVSEAAFRAGRQAVLVELRGQAKDHPILLSMPETEYLHFALVKIQ